jgi:7,8-dihydropterin-6-yl-methyl-4-(beta-D-ribofuranosyl)aminobenzene 5'-phosphate synthase
MKITFTTLCENTVGSPGFAGEWGLSVLVQTGDHNILFDTGAESAAVKNADKIGFDLKTVDTIILSHAHGDHTGGLREVLKRTRRPKIIAHPALWNPKFKRVMPGESLKYNGIPFRREEIEKFAELCLSKEPLKLSASTTTSGEISQTTDFEIPGSQFFFRKNNELHQDDFIDEQALIIQTPEGLVIVSGCAHRGILNTIHHARKITGEDTVHTVLGGTHLYPKELSDVRKTISELLNLGVQNIGVSHCTGLPAAMQLASAFGNRFFLNNTGSSHTLRFGS